MTTINNPSTTNKDALADIRNRKAAVKKQMDESASAMKEQFRSIFTPAQQPTSRFGNIMGMIDRGMAIYDGVVVGMKIIRSVRRLFGKKK